jgi:hypothetical protein
VTSAERHESWNPWGYGMPHLADAPALAPEDDGTVSWAHLAAVVILSWLGIAVGVGTIVGHGIAFGSRGEL